MYLGENRSWVPMRLESFSTDDGDGRNSRVFQTFPRLFQLAYKVKCGRIFQELISWRPH